MTCGNDDEDDDDDGVVEVASLPPRIERAVSFGSRGVKGGEGKAWARKPPAAIIVRFTTVCNSLANERFSFFRRGKHDDCRRQLSCFAIAGDGQG